MAQAPPHTIPRPTREPRKPPRRAGSTWRRSPFLLVRFPAVFVAIFGAAVVLGVSAAAGHLFLSSAGTEALRLGIARSSPSFSGLTVNLDGPISADRVAFRERLLDQAAGGVAGLGSPVFSAVDHSTIGVGPFRQGHVRQVVVATRTGFLGHVHVLARSGRAGWWVPESIASQMHLHAGGTIEIAVGDVAVGLGFAPTSPPIELPIAGMYRDLASRPVTSFWQPLYEFIYQQGEGVDAAVPPPFLLADPRRLLDLERTLQGQGRLQWELPVDAANVTLEDARSVAGSIQRIEADMSNPDRQVGAAFFEHTSGLGTLVKQADETATALAGSVGVIGWAGRIVALAVFVAAGVYGLSRRRVEYAMQQARGVGPFSLGVRSAIEALLPAAMGIAAGYWLAVVLVRWLGPNRLLSSDALARALVDVAVTLAVALVVLGVTVAFVMRSAASERRRGRLRRIAAKVPWEIVPLALAAAALYEIETHGVAPVVSGQGPPRVDVLVPLFPILFILGLAGLAARGLRTLLPRIRAAASRGPSAVYLAGGRIASSPRLATLLVTACTLAVGVMVYSGILVSSVRETAREKALVSVGSDTSIGFIGVPEFPKVLPANATEVVRLAATTLDTGPTVGVIGIDPKTFAHGAFWDPGFADRPLDEVLRPLSSPGGDALPVIVVNGELPSTFSMEFFGDRIPTRVVGTTSGFPGMPSDSPMLVAATPELERALGSATLGLEDVQGNADLWVSGDAKPVTAALEDARLFPSAVTTASFVSGTSQFLALSWLFGFLEALGLMAGLLALIALLLYVEARQRAREVSYSLASRMGLSGGSNLVSVGIELTGMLVVALVVGTALAAIGAFIIHQKVDPLPQLPPAALYRVPVGLLGAVAAALLIFAWLAAAIMQRRADRANVAEVMRLAG